MCRRAERRVVPLVREGVSECMLYIGLFNINRVIVKDLYNLSMSNGAAEWRKNEAKELSDLVQRRFHYLQVSLKTHFNAPN